MTNFPMKRSKTLLSKLLNKKIFFAVIPLMLVIGFASLTSAHAADLAISIYKPAAAASIGYQIQGYGGWCTIEGSSQGTTGWQDDFDLRTSDINTFAQPGDTILYIKAYSDENCKNPIPGWAMEEATIPSSASHCLANLSDGNFTCS